MKISKIASLAILGISLSTSAFATNLTGVNDAETLLTKIDTAEKAKQYFMEQLDVIYNSDKRPEFHNYSADITDPAVKTAFDNIAKMDAILGNLKADEQITTTATVDGKTATLVLLRDSSHSNKPKITLTITGAASDQAQTLIENGDFATPTNAKWNELFKTEHKKVLNELFTKISGAIDAKIKTDLTDKLTEKNTEIADQLTNDGITIQNTDAEYVANNADEFVKLLQNKYKEDPKKDEKLKKVASYLASESIAKDIQGVITSSTTEITTTDLTGLKGKLDGISSEKLVLGDDLKAAITKPDLDKVKKRAEAVKTKFEAIEELKTRADKGGITDEEKFQVIKDAFKAGIRFDMEGDNQSGNPANQEKIDGLSDVSSKTDEIGKAFTAAQAAIKKQADTGADNLYSANEAAKAILKKLEMLDKTTEALKAAQEARASLIADYLITGQDNKGISKLLSTATSNKVISELLSKTATDDLKKIIEKISDSASDTAKLFSNSSALDGVNFANSVATSTRLAQLSNPFNDNLALASAIKNLRNDSFADNSNASLSSVIKEYTDRFSTKNNLWGTLIGAKGEIKNSANPEFYGVSLGYDRAFDNTILGGFVSYAKSKASANLINSEADNYQLGVYSRTFIDNHEIDVKTSVSLAKNNLERSVVIGSKTHTQNGSFDSYLFNIGANYGYVISIDDALFIKPNIGLEYSYAKNKGFKESGELAFSYDSLNSNVLALNAGLEFRQFLNNNHYLYVTPGISSEIYKSNNKLKLGFVDGKGKVEIDTNSKKNTYFTLNTGLDIKLTDALSTNVNFGAKVASKAKYYNGTLGLKYKF